MKVLYYIDKVTGWLDLSWIVSKKQVSKLPDDNKSDKFDEKSRLITIQKIK